MKQVDVVAKVFAGHQSGSVRLRVPVSPFITRTLPRIGKVNKVTSLQQKSDIE